MSGVNRFLNLRPSLEHRRYPILSSASLTTRKHYFMRLYAADLLAS